MIADIKQTYRFSEIYGHTQLVAHLQQAIQSKRVTHAYLFCGMAGSGKHLIAETFAKALLCEYGGAEPCGKCKSCMTFEAGTHPDVIYVKAEKKSLGVDEVREKIVEDVGIKPYRYAHKVYIVEQADLMTPQAQNALLKTLEEPPEYAVILLLAEKQDVFLQTILSRVVNLQLRPLSETLVMQYLQEKKGVTQEQAALYAAYAQGSIGQALLLLEDTEFAQMRQDVLQKMQSIQRMSEASVFLWAKEWEAYKEDWRFLDIIQLWYRDLLIAKRLQDDTYLIQKDMQREIFACATEPASELVRKAEAAQKAKIRLSQNANFRLTIEVLLMELKEIRNQ